MTCSETDSVMVTPCDVALRLGQELSRLGRLADTMQGALAVFSVGDQGAEALQSLDLITQSLFALSGFIRDWALVLDGSIPSNIDEALANVSLKDISNRLAALGKIAGVEVGEMELFSTDV